MKNGWPASIDRYQFNALLRVYLATAFRSKSSSKAKRHLVPKTFLPFIIYGWFGFFITAMMVSRGASNGVYAFSAIAYTMVMVFFAVLHEFDTILITSEDADIIGHRPVNEATYSAAKLCSFTIYILFLCLSLALIPSAGALLIADTGWIYACALLAAAAVAGLASGYLVVIVYTELLTRISGKTLKDGITYLQIIFTLGLFVGIQLISGTGTAALPSLSHTVKIWALAMPPAWYASLTLLARGSGSPALWSAGAAAVVTTLLLVAGGASRFSMAGAMKMALLLRRSDMAHVTENSVEMSVPRFGRLFISGPEAQAGYLLTAKMVRRDRSIRAGVFSMCGILIATCILEFVKGGAANPFEATVGETGGFSYVAFFSIFIALSIINLVQYSIDWKGGWVFSIVPAEHPGRIYRGVISALAVRVFLPLYGGVFILYSVYTGVVYAFFNVLITVMMTLFSAAAGLFIVRNFPFSRQRVPGQRSRSFFILLLAVPLSAVFAVARPLIFKSIAHSAAAALLIGLGAYSVLRAAENLLDNRLRRS